MDIKPSTPNVVAIIAGMLNDRFARLRPAAKEMMNVASGTVVRIATAPKGKASIVAMEDV
jgi:hypothetical protein